MARFILIPSLKIWLISLISLSALISCKDKEKVASSSETEITQNLKLKEATVVDYTEKEKGCTFLIQLDEDKTLLQPFEKDIPENLRKEGAKILIDYLPSRRQQGSCLLGMPITINEIKKK